MADQHQGPGVLSALAMVRASGRVYARRASAAATALVLLHDQLVTAYAAGASVSELSDASGLSRPAIYRHLRPPRAPWPDD